VARAGDGFEDVVDFAGGGVEFEEEALGALLYVHGGCGVEEAEACCGVDDFDNAAHVQGPEDQGVGFHGYDLAWFDFCGGIGYPCPSVVEHCPLAEGLLGCGECCFAVADVGAGMVVDEAVGETRRWIEAVCEG